MWSKGMIKLELLERHVLLGFWGGGVVGGKMDVGFSILKTLTSNSNKRQKLEVLLNSQNLNLCACVCVCVCEGERCVWIAK